MATTIPKSGLRTLVATLSALPEAWILWDGEPKGPVSYAQDAKRLILNVVARRRVGEDEEKREYVADPDNLPDGLLLKRTFSGHRSLTVSVRAEDYAEEEGFDFLERIRVLIGADEYRAVLNTLELSLASVSDIRTINGVAGNRSISIATMDLILNQRVETVITAEGDTYISTVETEGDLTI